MVNWIKKERFELYLLAIFVLVLAVLVGFWIGNVYRLAIDKGVLEQVADLNECFS